MWGVLVGALLILVLGMMAYSFLRTPKDSEYTIDPELLERKLPPCKSCRFWGGKNAACEKTLKVEEEYESCEKHEEK